MSTACSRQFTMEDYLALEHRTGQRHEFYHGQVFAMAGGSLTHGVIIGNLAQALGSRIRALGCRVIPNDLRVKTPTGLHTYPDIVVVCGEPELDEDVLNTLCNPRVIFEVLSPSTENYDRTTKLDHYRTIPSLQECILVAQDRPQVIQVTRQSSQDEWLYHWRNGLNESLKLQSISSEIPLSEIYQQIEFPTEEPLLRPHDPRAIEP